MHKEYEIIKVRILFLIDSTLNYNIKRYDLKFRIDCEIYMIVIKIDLYCNFIVRKLFIITAVAHSYIAKMNKNKKYIVIEQKTETKIIFSCILILVV